MFWSCCCCVGRCKNLVFMVGSRQGGKPDKKLPHCSLVLCSNLPNENGHFVEVYSLTSRPNLGNCFLANSFDCVFFALLEWWIDKNPLKHKHNLTLSSMAYPWNFLENFSVLRVRAIFICHFIEVAWFLTLTSPFSRTFTSPPLNPSELFTFYWKAGEKSWIWVWRKHFQTSAMNEQGQTVHKLQIATFWDIYIYISLPSARLYIYIFSSFLQLFNKT